MSFDCLPDTNAAAVQTVARLARSGADAAFLLDVLGLGDTVFLALAEGYARKATS